MNPMTDIGAGARRTCIRGMKYCELVLPVVGFLASIFFTVNTLTASAGDLPRGLAFLLNEVPENTMGERHPGSVVWRTDRIKAAGQPDELVIHGDIGIPDINLTATMIIRRNTDESLPASHVIEVKFKVPKEFPGGEVYNAPGIMMKSSERARGIPFAALSVKTADNSFLVGLSKLDASRAQNLRLLRERSWFDIPMVYGNHHRGILAVEKWHDGEKDFNEVLTAWELSK